MAAASRTPREQETREAEEHSRSWEPASRLPVPLPQPGVVFRWVRAASYGLADNTNVSASMREGWVPVNASDHPELQIMSDKDSRFPGCVEVGGLLLCKNSIENVTARREYYTKRAADQLASVDNSFFRENDPRMPLSKPERRTRVTFGSGTPGTNSE